MKLKHIIFYIGFFVLYLAMQYYFLYHVNGLNPFAFNIHFFSNVIGSLSKRFLSEASIYGFIFYILYFYAKKWWSRVIFITLFLAFFLANVMAIAFYFFTRTNFQFYILEGFSFNILFSYFTLKVTAIAVFLVILMASMSYFLFITKNTSKEVWPLKKLLFLVLLCILAAESPFLNIIYSDHISVMAGDSLQKKFYRLINLEKSGISVLAKEIEFQLSPPKTQYQPLNDDEKKQVAENNLDTQIIQEGSFHPKKIILVVAESLSQKFLSHYNNEISGSTPNLDSFITEYQHIDDFYPSGSYTLMGVSAALCGTPNDSLAEKDLNYKCAPKVMSDSGFKNQFIRGATKYYVGENVHFKKFGFDSIFAKEDFAEKYPDFKKTHSYLYNTWGYTDNFVFDEAVERLKQAKPEDKLFLGLLTLDTHVAGGRCYYNKTDNDPENPVLYSAECFDRVFGEFINKLKKENLFNDDLAVIVTADHLYPGFNTVPGDEFNTSFVLKPGKIPFLLITPADVKLKAKTGSSVDIAATLLDMSGNQIPDYYLGKSLISNPYVIPVGQDRTDGYMISKGQFYALSLNPDIQQYQKTDGPTGYFIQASSQDEIMAIAQQKIDEKEEKKNQQSGFFKWYYNKFFGLTE